MTWLVVIFFLGLPGWLVCAALGLFASALTGRHRRFFARMLLLTPIWPLVATAVLGPLLVRSGLWLLDAAVEPADEPGDWPADPGR
jgi:hypothetical protein